MSEPGPQICSIAAAVEAEIEVKRSRFLARLEPVTDETAARACVEAARKRHWDARHHCSAFVLGVEGAVGRGGVEGVIRRSSDDGEPAGTAGAPMLEVLTGREVSDVVAVVTRWFGGTLLGTGGLIRAYGDAVRAALDVARPVRYRLLQRLDLDTAIAQAGRIENELRSRGILVAGTDYAGCATLHLDVEPEQAGDLVALVSQLTGGQGTPRLGGTQWARA
ncbi:IMPACT family protein [Gephyromycinifex aptenodytis]|uniref:IMPACT family protein n=1 Tax=Gephyromycinifex aptenodytis TaxID=2716227 RepID=UPI0014468748|nr:YigZ family protein [Gephyromycinifex aptenodytis]